MTLDAHVTGIWCGQIGGGVWVNLYSDLSLSIIPPETGAEGNPETRRSWMARRSVPGGFGHNKMYRGYLLGLEVR